MKKIGKKLSFLTKIFLVVGLLFSNLSGLSCVFAYEGTDSLVITLNDENKLVIKYTDTTLGIDNVKMVITEDYTYMDETSETRLNKELDNVSVSTLNSDEGYEYDPPMLSNVKYDGNYYVNVSIYDGEEHIASNSYSKEIKFEEGLSFKVYDLEDEEILPNEDGVYEVNGNVNIIYNILTGGLDQNDEVLNDNGKISMDRLLALDFDKELIFDGRLYGEYAEEIELKFPREDGTELVISDTLNIKYKDYSDNADEMNDSIFGSRYAGTYNYMMSTKDDGKLFVYPETEKGYSVLDIIDMLDNRYSVVDENNEETLGIVEYDIIDKDGNSLKEEFSSYYENLEDENKDKDFELVEYFEDRLIEDGYVIKLTCMGLEIQYEVIIVGDFNGNLVIDEEDVKSLIDQFVGIEEKDLLRGDLNSNEDIDDIDVYLLNDALVYEYWNDELDDVEVESLGELFVTNDYIESGDLFDIQYKLILTSDELVGLSGLIDYDKDVMELVDIKTEREWVGNTNEDKFMYIDTTTDYDLLSDMRNSSTNINDAGQTFEKVEDEVLVTFTFRALKSSESEVKLNKLHVFYYDDYETLGEEEYVSTNVIINASGDNTLKSIIVNNGEIPVEDGKLDYEIEVENDVVEPEIEALVNNDTANVDVISGPEELKDGDNEFTIQVTAENGDVLIYNLNIKRKPKVEEAKPVVYQNTVEEDNTTEEETPVLDTDKEEEKKDDKIEEKDGKLSRIIIIILILLVVAGLIYLIFKDDDEDSKKTNKDIDSYKKDKDIDEVPKKVNKANNKNNVENKKKKKD